MAHLCSHFSLEECKTIGTNWDQKVTVKIPHPQFLTMQGIGTKTFHNMNPFYIQNLGSRAGKAKNANCLMNDTLLVEVFNKKQLE